MEPKKPFRYFAIKVGGVVIFRRTVGQLQKVHSRLYKPASDFFLEQTTYVGGRVIGCMPYLTWQQRMPGNRIGAGIFRVTREQYRALDPYITKAKTNRNRKQGV